MMPKHGDLTENNKRRVEATEMDALRRSSRISRKDRITNVTIRQQIGLEETIIKEIEQNELTWYGHVQRMTEERLPKIALKWMPKQNRTRGRLKKNWMKGIKKAMNDKNLNEGPWENRKQWSLYIHIKSLLQPLYTASLSLTAIALGHSTLLASEFTSSSLAGKPERAKLPTRT